MIHRGLPSHKIPTPPTPDWATDFGVERMRELYVAAEAGDKRARYLIRNIFLESLPPKPDTFRPDEARLLLWEKELQACQLAEIEPPADLEDKIKKHRGER